MSVDTQLCFSAYGEHYAIEAFPVAPEAAVIEKERVEDFFALGANQSLLPKEGDPKTFLQKMGIAAKTMNPEDVE